MSGYITSCQVGAMGVATDAARAQQLRQQITTLAEEFCDRPGDFTDAMMGVLAGYGIEEPEVSLSLLTPHGVALCELARTPDATLRELSVRLGCSEGWVQKVLTQLAASGFVSRTRVGQRVMYKIARNTVLGTADSRRLGVLFSAMAAQIDVEVLDSTD